VATDMNGFQSYLDHTFGLQRIDQEIQACTEQRNRKIQVDKYKLKMMVDKGQSINL
jgi:hypothetical protein